jgi:hypothetical protein
MHDRVREVVMDVTVASMCKDLMQDAEESLATGDAQHHGHEFT